jgi:hypothetical protein
MDRNSGNETAHQHSREGTVYQLFWTGPALGVSRQNIRKEIKLWTDNQLVAMWRGLISTHRQARQLISGPSPTAKTRLLSFDRTQSRAGIGLLIGHSNLERHLYKMGLIDSPLCRRCGAQEETSPHVLYECEVLSSLKHAYFESFFLDPEDVRSLSLGQSGTL